MTAISKSKHYKFIYDVQIFLSKLLERDCDKIRLQSDIEILEDLYKRYQDNIVLLHSLIATYETMQNSIKVNLRKQQLQFIKQKYL